MKYIFNDTFVNNPNYIKFPIQLKINIKKKQHPIAEQLAKKLE